MKFRILNRIEVIIREIPSGLEEKIENMGFCVRVGYCLKYANIKTLGDLLLKTENDLIHTRNFGKRALQEVKEKLKERGLQLKDENT